MSAFQVKDDRASYVISCLCQQSILVVSIQVLVLGWVVWILFLFCGGVQYFNDLSSGRLGGILHNTLRVSTTIDSTVTKAIQEAFACLQMRCTEHTTDGVRYDEK